ncbi:ESX-4 secretion system protein EccC4 [Chaetomidium leptoderma]|uniref:ESX-4 secretion system protein EccC4 n=1 Tax=Chaetomidium leptoderma TaxID=669021 RepID=A0AAN6ZUY2_9PEZI|nr:ESX-4 secretion system protein EccC4 [Chaetomidium leptoderma]
MEGFRTMLACMTGRRGRHEGYTEVIYDDKMALYSDNEPYTQHDAMSYQHGATTPLTDKSHNSNNDYYYNSGDGDMRTVKDIASEVARLLWLAEWNDDALQGRISEAVGDRRWNRTMVEECLDNVIEYVEQGRTEMGAAMCEALDKATDVADGEFAFPRRHPQSLDGFIAIVSVGVLAELQGAWVLELLGFGQVRGKEALDGTGEIAMLTSDKIVLNNSQPRSNSFAAWWQTEYEAYIPSGSVYSFLRGMDMVELED